MVVVLVVVSLGMGWWLVGCGWGGGWFVSGWWWGWVCVGVVLGCGGRRGEGERGEATQNKYTQKSGLIRLGSAACVSQIHSVQITAQEVCIAR